uniref:Uncharacterized protein n=1 Tax=Arundo donax TaxID=35708 RepID=A0A0A9F0M5_ARUDO
MQLGLVMSLRTVMTAILRGVALRQIRVLAMMTGMKFHTSHPAVTVMTKLSRKQEHLIKIQIRLDLLRELWLLMKESH